MHGIIKIDGEITEISAIWNESDNPKAILVIAHGAGAGMMHSFMESLAISLQEQELTVLRFNFPYIDQGRRSPDSPKKAQQTIKDVVNFAHNTYPELPIFVGGKSYGGRMASHCAAQKTIPATEGLIFYGFPLHAPGKDSKERATHLVDVGLPMLFLQGTKDKLANIDMISDVTGALSRTELKTYESADHSFKTPKSSGRTIEQNINQLALDTKGWIEKILS